MMDDLAGWDAGSRLLAVERQANGEAGTFARSAAHSHMTGKQRHQPLHDGEAKTGPVVTTVIRTLRLEELVAEAREILLADADAVVLDGDQDIAVLDAC